MVRADTNHGGGPIIMVGHLLISDNIPPKTIGIPIKITGDTVKITGDPIKIIGDPIKITGGPIKIRGVYDKNRKNA